MSNTVKILALNNSSKQYQPAQIDNSGNLLVSASINTAGLATLTEQQSQTVHLATIAGDTTSLDTKIVACDTSSVVVSSGTITETNSSSIDTKLGLVATESTLQSVNTSLSGLATESTLVSLNSKITACDTSSLATESTLTSLNSKITACDTTTLATESTVLSVASNTLNTKTAVDAVNTTLTTGTLSTSETNSTAIKTAVETVAGCVSSNKVAVVVSSTDKGSKANIENSTSISASSVSSLAPTVSGFGANAVLYFECDTLSNDGFAVEASIDGSVYHTYQHVFTEANYNSTKSFAVVHVNCSGVQKIRIRNLSSSISLANVLCSIVA